MACIATYGDAETARKGLPEAPPDVVLLDIGLPGMTGIELLRSLVEYMPATDFIMLTVSEQAEDVFNSVCMGATGYLVKETPPDMIIRAIEEVKGGGAPMSSGIARKVIDRIQKHPKPDVLLSDRELEILRSLCDGNSYTAVGRQLFISGNTVRAHIKNIYRKLQVHSRAEVVKKAMRDGLV